MSKMRSVRERSEYYHISLVAGLSVFEGIALNLWMPPREGSGFIDTACFMIYY